MLSLVMGMLRGRTSLAYLSVTRAVSLSELARGYKFVESRKLVLDVCAVSLLSTSSLARLD